MKMLLQATPSTAEEQNTHTVRSRLRGRLATICEKGTKDERKKKSNGPANTVIEAVDAEPSLQCCVGMQGGKEVRTHSDPLQEEKVGRDHRQLLCHGNVPVAAHQQRALPPVLEMQTAVAIGENTMRTIPDSTFAFRTRARKRSKKEIAHGMGTWACCGQITHESCQKVCRLHQRTRASFHD